MIGETTLKKPGLVPETLWDIEHYKEVGLYFYLEATQDILPNGRVNVENHGEMIMLGSYSYLGLIGHPKINAAAQTAVDHYGTGTHGVRLLAGSLKLHNELEARIAAFKQTEEAITFSSAVKPPNRSDTSRDSNLIAGESALMARALLFGEPRPSKLPAPVRSRLTSSSDFSAPLRLQYSG